MKKIVLFFLSFFIFISAAISQTIIENPEKPIGKNAGRVLKLQEVFRIIENSDDFYFNSPRNLKVDYEGSFLIIDENQILKFSSDGKFLKNLFKKGQGPGEISSRSHSRLSYFLLKNDIFLYDPTGSKIIHIDGDGNLIEEVKIEVSLLSELYGPANEGFIFTDEAPSPMGKSGFHDVDMSIIWISRDGSSSRKVIVFPKELYMDKNFAMDWAPFYGLLESEAQKLFICHTSEYKIVIADLGKGQVIKEFNRK
ncbi:MAG: 6-bladed beta-propeller, partial [Candidatus Aminicenantaceae bacterium]